MGEKFYESHQPYWDQEFNETVISAEQHLDSMREWLQSEEKFVRIYPLREEYEPAAANLKQIHEQAILDSDNINPYISPEKLFIHFIKYKEHVEFNENNSKINLSFDFLSSLYACYARDVSFFTEHLKPRIAPGIALYHKPDIIYELNTAYAGHEFITKSDIKEAFVRNALNPLKFIESLDQNMRAFQNEVEPALREEYNLPGRWPMTIVKSLCYHRDPETKAREIFNQIDVLGSRYPHADTKTVENWATYSALNKNNKQRWVKDLLEEAPTLDPSEADLEVAKNNLTLLRQQTLQNSESFTTHHSIPLEVHKLINTLKLNRRQSFDSLDAIVNGQHIHDMIKLHNSRLSSEESSSAIEINQSNLYNLMCVFAEDVAELSQVFQPHEAEKIARYHSPDVYDYYIGLYENEPALTPNIIGRLILKRTTKIDQSIREIIERFDKITEKFESVSSLELIRQFALRGDGMERIENYMEFIGHAKNRYPWVEKSDIEKFFYAHKEPEAAFAAWANKVETIGRFYPNDKRLRLYKRKLLALTPGNIHDNVSNYLNVLKDKPSTTPEEHLNDMREWLLWRGSVTRDYKILREYASAVADLEQIHQKRKSHDPTIALTDNIPQKLLGNFVRYMNFLENDGIDHKITLSYDFLRGLYRAYTEDVKFFAANVGARNAANIALYHNSRLLIDLQDIYKDHPLITRSMVKLSIMQKLINPLESLENSEHKLDLFQNEIEPRLREEYNLPGQWSSDTLQRLSKRSDGEERARKIMSLCSEVSAKYPNADPSTIEHLITRALTYGDETVEQLNNLLQDIPLLNPTPQDLATARDNLNRLRKASKQLNFKKNNLRVQQLVATINANWRESFESLDVTNAARFVRSAVYAHNLELKAGDIAIDTSQGNLYNLFCVFAEDVAQLKQEPQPWAAEKVAQYHAPGVYDRYREKYKGEPSLPRMNSVESFIVRRPDAVDDQIKKYIGRYNVLKEVYGPTIIDAAKMWFAKFTNSVERVDKYLDFVKDLSKIFKLNNEEIDDESLQNLGIYTNSKHGKSPETQYNRFIEIRDYLKEEFRDDDNIEKWMVDFAASFVYSKSYAAYRLRVLRAFKIRGNFNLAPDASDDEGRSRYGIMEDKNAINPEDAIIQEESNAEQLALIENLLANLSNNDRAAVETVFGLSGENNKKELQEALGVENLDEYVTNTLLPRLRN